MSDRIPGDEDALEAAARAIVSADDPAAAAQEFAEALAAASRRASSQDAGGPPGLPGVRVAEPRPFSLLGLLLAFATAAGMAAAITLLFQGMAVVMRTEGGFVATGGPYVIAHPAPGWVWVMPVSVLAMLLFAVLGFVASARGWGVNLTLFAWMGLFVSLGWNFLRFGLEPPAGTQGAWGWIVCGVVFWLMGFGPALLVVKWFRDGFRRLVERQDADARRAWRTPSRGDTTAVYLVGQLAGVLAGVAAGVVLFQRVAG